MFASLIYTGKTGFGGIHSCDTVKSLTLMMKNMFFDHLKVRCVSKRQNSTANFFQKNRIKYSTHIFNHSHALTLPAKMSILVRRFNQFA